MTGKLLTVKGMGGTAINVSKSDFGSTAFSVVRKQRNGLSHPVYILHYVGDATDRLIVRRGPDGVYELVTGGFFVYLPDASAASIASFLGITVPAEKMP